MKLMRNVVAGFTLAVLSFFISLQAVAQEKGADINVDITDDGDSIGNAWYNQPWVWIVGATVFILILAALLRGSKVPKD